MKRKVFFSLSILFGLLLFFSFSNPVGAKENTLTSTSSIDDLNAEQLIEYNRLVEDGYTVVINETDGLLSLTGYIVEDASFSKNNETDGLITTFGAIYGKKFTIDQSLYYVYKYIGKMKGTVNVEYNGSKTSVKSDTLYLQYSFSGQSKNYENGGSSAYLRYNFTKLVNGGGMNNSRLVPFQSKLTFTNSGGVSFWQSLSMR